MSEELRKRFLYPVRLLTSSSDTAIFFLFGIILLGLGVFIFLNGNVYFTKSNTVEVLQSTTEGEKSSLEVVVEIAGAVEKPGVYKLSSGSRVDDLLISAGGVSADADREWIAKNINRASKLTDGYKLYIPLQSEVLSAKTDVDIKVDQGSFSTRSNGLININNASLNQLDTLPGIGPVYGQSIIEHRPYSNLEELVSKGAIKQSVFEKIKDLVTIY